MDILAARQDGGPELVDVTIVARISNDAGTLARAAETPGAMAGATETENMACHPELPNLVPFILETYGGIGPLAKSLARKHVLPEPALK